MPQPPQLYGSLASFTTPPSQQEKPFFWSRAVHVPPSADPSATSEAAGVVVVQPTAANIEAATAMGATIRFLIVT